MDFDNERRDDSAAASLCEGEPPPEHAQVQLAGSRELLRRFIHRYWEYQNMVPLRAEFLLEEAG